jgi:hypothetical protein
MIILVKNWAKEAMQNNLNRYIGVVLSGHETDRSSNACKV